MTPRYARYEVIACHRLGKKDANSPAPTIIRFFNRKIVEHCIKNPNKIKGLRCKWNISFREDLSEANQAIFDECAVLKDKGVITRFYTRNGFVKVVKPEPPVKPITAIKICHSIDLLKHFPDYYRKNLFTCINNFLC